MRGKLYSVGIGPGDPELLTLKAVRLLKECDVVALPKGDGDIMTAKNIVNQVVNIDEKEHARRFTQPAFMYTSWCLKQGTRLS